MEKIKLTYIFEDDTETKTIEHEKNAEDGLHDYEVCEIFEDFMRSVGFSEENVIKYFQN